ncbi:glycosyl transferase family protein [Pacificimonas sp. WHA3]|uniref:Glycosyl transferase family protein n=1 Tax=Pacificimonas pallii TaxID=2827236 RepID=A0ABS6SBC3_9SPHN|nr:glycosyl transferase family protein [Pacificimonas pallii]MBV7255621.1 glycosyl transferase family protein [Pacificimonas pallii]
MDGSTLDAALFWAYFWVVTREFLFIAAIGIVVFGIDEIIVDLIYLGTSLKKKLVTYRRHARWTVSNIPVQQPEGRFAIFIPAWDESEVIAPMLRRLTSIMDHGNYDVFIGVYPNDPDTLAAVTAVGNARIRIVMNDRDGPTTKADCLNRIWEVMSAQEQAGGFTYKGIVLHDAEDVVHAAEMRIFDYLMPRFAMVQLPVIPLRDNNSRWISGHYQDEFAEHHGKTLVVRETLGAAIPSAGVACAFDREVLGELAAESGAGPFDADSLTEDYELGMALSRRRRGIFVRLPEKDGSGAVATREHFPADLESALRQKTRWLLGIAFQSWDRLGWKGTLADKYMMLRDRKPMMNAIIIFIAYIASILFAVTIVARWLDPVAARLPSVIPEGSFIAFLILLATISVLWRLFMRFWFTTSVYGLVDGLLSIPRVIIANVVGMLAARRALWRYAALVFTGKALAWEKTAHRFPDEKARHG